MVNGPRASHRALSIWRRVPTTSSGLRCERREASFKTPPCEHSALRGRPCAEACRVCLPTLRVTADGFDVTSAGAPQSSWRAQRGAERHEVTVCAPLRGPQRRARRAARLRRRRAPSPRVVPCPGSGTAAAPRRRARRAADSRCARAAACRSSELLALPEASKRGRSLGARALFAPGPAPVATPIARARAGLNRSRRVWKANQT